MAEIVTKGGRLVSWYLILSYLYYVRDISITSDENFDNLYKALEKDWYNIEHPHKHLLHRDSLKTGFYITDYPTMVISSAMSVVNNNIGVPTFV